jgi:hypothetical protein
MRAPSPIALAALCVLAPLACSDAPVGPVTPPADVPAADLVAPDATDAVHPPPPRARRALVGWMLRNPARVERLRIGRPSAEAARVLGNPDY